MCRRAHATGLNKLAADHTESLLDASRSAGQLRHMKSAAASIPGVRVRHVELSIGGLDLFVFSEYGHAFPRHSHESVTLGVFGEGNGSITVQRGTFKAARGSVLAIGADQAHAAEPARGRGWTYRSIYPSRELLDVAAGPDSLPGRAFTQPVIRDDDLARRISRVHSALDGGPASMRIEESLLGVLRSLLGRHTLRHRGTVTVPSSKAVSLARSYIDENFARPVKLAELATLCGITAWHLVHSFRESTGMPPHVYLTQVRVGRAREMLLDGDALSSVAYRCGFADQSHLTRVFKRIHGITPGAYVTAMGR
jgi:AraC-like DNA-binding protein